MTSRKRVEFIPVSEPVDPDAQEQIDIRHTLVNHILERATMNHTPGPWEIDEGDGMPIAKVSFRAITAPGIAYVGSGLSKEEIDANARLIAAAPDLLLALQLILTEPHGCPMCDSGKLRNPAKTHWPECGFAHASAALAKVIGIEP